MARTAIFAALALATLLLSCSVTACGLAADHPNVLLIMTDDQGYGDVRSHGNPAIDTPVMDALARSGARFERFFVSPVCAPTRASLLTGRYNLRTGTHGVTRGRENMRSEEVTIAEILKAAGYATGIFGKWHNGRHYPMHPNGQGFDEFVGFCAGHWNNYFSTGLEHNGRPIKTEGYIADVLTDRAIGFIEKHKAGPFFCYVPLNTPHSPWQVPDRYWDKYKQRGLPDKTACAYAMCENIDENLGRLLAKLDELHLADNTIVLFLTDNGPNSDRYNGGMKGRKGSVNEGGVRVPLFVRWPGKIKPGTKVTQIAQHIDLLPTLVELCGVPMLKNKRLPLPLDGKSLAPLLLGKSVEWPDRMLFTFRSRGGRPSSSLGAVRTQRYRAVRGGAKRPWELYDMVADPGQKKNIARQYPQLTARLGKAFEKSFREVTAGGFKPLPIPIGHAERRRVVLPGHEAFLQPAPGQGISYVGRSGWANDWITHWTSTKSFPRWQVDVVRGGRYEITLMYVCPQSQLGSTVRVTIAGRSLTAKITKAHDPKPLPSPDRIARGEVYEKLWAPLKLGIVELPKGRTTLDVKALSIAAERVMDLKEVHVRRVE
ncbi:MAG: arylsulfatase [Planctomycetes bacterium]|nr:arylsulfatase [Planctomycetota bacterium]